MHESPREQTASCCSGTEGCEKLDPRAAIAAVNHLLCVAKDLGYPAAAVPAQSGLRDQVLGAFRVNSNAVEAPWRMGVCDMCAYILTLFLEP